MHTLSERVSHQCYFINIMYTMPCRSGTVYPWISYMFVMFARYIHRSY
jgi:hypothetical protein